MLNISSLERRWLKYKIKSYLPYLLVFITTAAVIAAIIVVVIPNKSDLKVPKAIKTTTPQKKLPNILPEGDMVLEPSMQFIQSISSNSQQPQIINTTAQPLQSKKSIKSDVALPATPIQTVAVNTPSVSITAPPPVIKTNIPTMKRDSTTFDISEIENRFKENSNPHLGLYIARYHYDHANYNEAYNYALKTNSLNKNIDESWLIFAKSLVKLGKSDQAKKTLQIYISQSNSENAKNLLASIEQGSVK